MGFSSCCQFLSPGITVYELKERFANKASYLPVGGNLDILRAIQAWREHLDRKDLLKIGICLSHNIHRARWSCASISSCIHFRHAIHAFSPSPACNRSLSGKNLKRYRRFFWATSWWPDVHEACKLGIWWEAFSTRMLLLNSWKCWEDPKLGLMETRNWPTDWPSQISRFKWLRL